MPALLRTAATLLLLLSAVTGILYPALVTGAAVALFPGQAGGSVVLRDGRVVGSSLVGQPFTGERYFHGRPSAATTADGGAPVSGGSNLGPSNPALWERIAKAAGAVRAADPGDTRPVPVDLVTASGSGLDPHISPEGAERQVGRVAKARGVDPAAVLALVRERTEGSTLGFIGAPRVNVLRLNLALDRMTGGAPGKGGDGRP
jgi:K+-transporting ATPase ATPase C chain